MVLGLVQRSSAVRLVLCLGPILMAAAMYLYSIHVVLLREQGTRTRWKVKISMPQLMPKILNAVMIDKLM